MTINFAPVFSLANASATVRGFLYGPGGPLRFYAFGEADQKTPRPYAVWQTVGGSPENYIGQNPDADDWSVQVDVYSDKAGMGGQTEARNIAYALVEALQEDSYITSWTIEGREPTTRLYRIGFIADFITHRT